MDDALIQPYSSYEGSKSLEVYTLLATMMLGAATRPKTIRLPPRRLPRH